MRSAPSASGVHAEAGDLPDVNVWLALAAPSHVHHAAARAYWMQPALPRLWFNRITMLGLVRLLCEPKVMGAAKLPPARALEAYEHFEALPEVAFMDEPAGCGLAFAAALRSTAPSSGRLLTDLYLACFAQAAQLRLVTFDRDFERFAGLTVLRLSSAKN